MISSDDGCGARRRQSVSFSLSIRSSRAKRSRLTQLPKTPQICEEIAHYPVFNPQDPRHNPSLRMATWPDDGCQLPSATGSTGSVRWIQNLPRRSLRRARSGLLALRSGLSRRSVHQGSSRNDDISGGWSSSDSAGGSSDRNDDLFSSAVSEASTEEDYDFGFNLYRTGCRHPSDCKNDTNDDSDFLSCAQSPQHTPVPTPYSGSDSLPGLFLAETTPNASERVSVRATGDTDMAPDSNEVQTTMHDSCGTKTFTEEEHQSSVSSPASSSNSCSESSPEVVLIPDESSHPAAAPSSSPTDIRDSPAPIVATELEQPGFPPYRSSSSTSSDTAPALDAGTQIIDRTSEFDEPISPPIPESAFTSSQGIQTTAEEPSINALDDGPQDPELGYLGCYLSLNSEDDSNPLQSSNIDEEPRSSWNSEEHTNKPLNPWLSLDIDRSDRTSLLSLRDEYFIVDGKSNDLHPDRGDNPIKAESLFAGDGGLYSGPGLDRSLSVRAPEIPEIVGPGTAIGMQGLRPLRTQREGSDSTDEYLVTYSLLHRHYFS